MERESSRGSDQERASQIEGGWSNTEGVAKLILKGGGHIGDYSAMEI